MVNLARRIARKQQSLQKKGITKNIEALGQMLKAMPNEEERLGIKEALENMSQLNTAVAYLVNDIQQLIYENDKQRMVNIRIIQTATEETPSFLVGRGPQKKHYSAQELVALTSQYAAEYDAIYAISLLAPQAG